MRPPGGTWVGVAGLDLVRDASGELLVLEDNLRTPSGFAYAVEARRAVLARLDVPEPLAPRTLAGLPELLGATLRAAAPDGAEDPYVVVLTDGEDNSAAFEHAWAADQLGIPLVEPGDLELRGDVLRHRGRAVDVVYRRTDADTVDTEVGRLLVPAQRAGTLGLVNAFGTGVADDKLAHAYVEELVRFHLGEEPLLRSVETLDLCVPEQLRARARRARDARRQAAERSRRARRDRLRARRARGRRAHARAADRAAGPVHRPADRRDLPAPDGDRRRAPAPPRGFATLRVHARRRRRPP